MQRILLLTCALWCTPALSRTLTLSDAEQRAVTTSYEMRVQAFEERSKEWEKRNAIAGYMPSVSYGLDYTQMDDRIVDAANKSFDSFEGMSQIPTLLGLLGSQHDFGDPINQTFASLLAAGAGSSTEAEDPFAASRLYQTTFKHSVTLNQPITNGGVEIVAIGIAKETKRAIELQMDAVELEVIYNTRKAYFDALAAAQRTAVAQQDLSWTKQNFENARIRQQSGAIPMTDLLQWEAEVAQKEGDLLLAEATERFLLLSLYQSIGVAAEKVDTSVNLQPFEVFENWYNSGGALPDGSVKDNPQLQSIQALTTVADRAKQVAVTQFLPKLNTFWAYSWPYYLDADRQMQLRDEQRGWTAGAMVSVPLFSGMRNSTNYQKTKYAAMKAEVELQQVTNQFEVNVKRIRLFHKAAYESVVAAKKQQELMEKNLDIMQKRYDGGLVNQSQLLEVSLGARMARIGYIHKVFECLLLESEYKKAIGKLEVSQ